MRRLLVVAGLLTLAGCRTFVAVPTAEPFDSGIRAVKVEGAEVPAKNGVWTAYAGPYYSRIESQVGGLQAKARTTNAKPRIILDADDDSADRLRLVKMEIEPKDSSRHVKLSIGGDEIDRDWVIGIYREKQADGTWAITVPNPLPRGEYAIWHPRGKADPREGHTIWPGRERNLKFQQFMGGVLYSFGVDD